jgi:hypothetical protein
MEITDEIKRKVFSQYWEQEVAITGIKSDEFGNEDENGSYPLDTVNNIQLAVCDKLLLKPISELSNEDAIEVAVLAGMVRPMNRFEFVISRHINYAKHILSDYFEEYRPVEDEITGNVWLLIFQYLQSKGYDIPQYLLGGKTLKECNLAVYENEN